MFSLTVANNSHYCSHMATLDDHTALLESLKLAIRISGKPKRNIALEAGIHPTTLHRILAGKRDIPLKTLFAIAQSINIPPTKLIDRSLCQKCITQTRKEIA